MPATSKHQQIAAAIALHAPSRLFRRNRGLLSMTPGMLKEFAKTKRKGLPGKKRPRKK